MTDTQPQSVSDSQARLKSFASRIDNIEQEMEARIQDIKEIYNEAKGEGFDVKILRKAMRLLKVDRRKREEERDLIDLYMSKIEE